MWRFLVTWPPLVWHIITRTSALCNIGATFVVLPFQPPSIAKPLATPLDHLLFLAVLLITLVWCSSASVFYYYLVPELSGTFFEISQIETPLLYKHGFLSDNKTHQLNSATLVSYPWTDPSTRTTPCTPNGSHQNPSTLALILAALSAIPSLH